MDHEFMAMHVPTDSKPPANVLMRSKARATASICLLVGRLETLAQ